MFSIYDKTFHCLLAKNSIIKKGVLQISSICNCSHVTIFLKQSEQF